MHLKQLNKNNLNSQTKLYLTFMSIIYFQVHTSQFLQGHIRLSEKNES